MTALLTTIIAAFCIVCVLGIWVVFFDDEREGLPNDRVDEHEQDHWEAQGKPMSRFPIGGGE